MAADIHEVVSFKCSRHEAKAWCTACEWSTSTETATRAVLVDRRARRHTESTGHETRVDTTHQRGFMTAHQRDVEACEQLLESMVDDGLVERVPNGR